MCIPAMIFGVSFAINVDEENIRWTKTSWSLSITRVLLGLATAYAIEFILRLALNPISSKHTSIYFF